MTDSQTGDERLAVGCLGAVLGAITGVAVLVLWTNLDSKGNSFGQMIEVSIFIVPALVIGTTGGIGLASLARRFVGGSWSEGITYKPIAPKSPPLNPGKIEPNEGGPEITYQHIHGNWYIYHYTFD